MNEVDITALDEKTVLLVLPNRGIREVGHFEYRGSVAPEQQLVVRLAARAAGYGRAQTTRIEVPPNMQLHIRAHQDQSVAQYVLSLASE